MLTTRKCDHAYGKEKPYKLTDGRGLYLHVMQNGRRYWRFKYTFLGRERVMAFGVFPEVTLAEARGRHEEARKLNIVEEKKSTRHVQKIDNGIEAQKRVLEIPGREWKSLMDKGRQRGILTPKEAGILEIAAQIPRKIPSEKQSMILIEFLDKAHQEGINLNVTS